MIDDAIIERVCSFIRVGASPKNAIVAAGIKEENVADFIDNADYEIKRATAQFIVLSCNRIMSEGGASGAKYLLQQSNNAKQFLEDVEPDAVEGLGLDFNLDDLLK